MTFSHSIYVGEKLISPQSPVFIIAEAGVNHNGSIERAKELIEIAAEAKADAVKFQTFRTENLILRGIEKAPYQKTTTEASESQYEMLKKLELTRQNNLVLKEHAERMGVMFLTTPFDEESLDELDGLDLPAYKVASTDATNLPFLRKIAAKGKPIFFSTGMCYLSEIELALAEIWQINKDVVLLQCSANYPLADKEVNLNMIRTYQDHFDMLVGYSDHSVGVGAAPFSVPMGARVVEKHFTTSKTLEGPDHLASLDPQELAEFVTTVRRVESYLGSGIKIPTISEVKTRASLQKCLVAARALKQGEFIGSEDIIGKRTGGIGLSPIYTSAVVGTRAQKDFEKNEIIVV